MTNSQQLPPPLHVVWRHGGRSADKWRAALRTYVPSEAWKHFYELHDKMQQGGVSLRRYVAGEEVLPLGGEVLKHAWSPRAPSRW
jgi:hypothetical protein